MNDRPVSFVNLLTYLLTCIPKAHCLVAEEGLMSIVWCKIEFQRRRSNFDEKFVHFEGYGAIKKLSKEFLNKGCGLRGLNKLLKNSCKKLVRRQNEAAALKAYRICLFFYSVIFMHKLDVTRKEYIITLQIFSAAMLSNIIKMRQHLIE